MIDEAFEFLISQYADRTLAPVDVAAVESRIAQDPEAAELLKQYRALDALVGSAALQMPLPAINYDALAAHISSAVDEDRQAGRMRIGNWMRRGIGLALAASLVAGFSIWAIVASRGGGGAPKPGEISVVTPKPNPHALRSIELVDPDSGPAAQVADAQPVITVQAPTLAEDPSRSADSYAMESMVKRPHRVQVMALDTSHQQDNFPLFR